ncbi:MAG: hypothetical protein IPO60_08960 [Flavobacteriales bacterium]|jgi:hypothetical protein|nr:hypothetical protein [Flavobacteriales bacterium]MBK7248078.1 hypothetical protein [Flavobacteriales bacterium]MBK7287991.1 hypothetical protein [Flavobacteriales bacterium]MBK9598436.1 hypothetical protein [Flavobacteriales bacterium]QQS73345.1 MAG: hypothetical protein IPP95_03710 [Flavobacteriales bacterium]
MSGFRQAWRGVWAVGLAAWLAPALAQHWESAGVPSFMIYPYICYADTANDALYTGSNQPFIVDGVGYYALYRYHGGQWDTLGLFGNTIRSAIVYNDTLIVGGGFQTVHDQPLERISCYVDGTWQSYGTFGPGIVSRLRIIDGDLYALGIFDIVDGAFCNGLAKRVGGHWEPVGTLPIFNGDGSAWFLDAINYQGQLVVTGNFTSADQTIHDIMAFNGTSWQPVCQCMTGGMDGGGSLAVYQGDLYLGGRFYFGPGNVGQGLMRWDGVQWHQVGQSDGGLQLYDHSDQYPPTVHGFTIRDGLLLVAGAFFFADHVPAAGVASWDGSQWCSLGGGPASAGGFVSAMDFYQDTLYIGCGQIAEGQEVNGVARFIGSSYQEECAATGIQETVTNVGLRVLSPRPGTIVLTGLSDGPHALRVYDAQGRLVLARPINSTNGRTAEVQLDEQPAALYLIQVDEVQRAKYIPVQ